MGTKHPHAEIIKAWADGADIQLRDVNGDWLDTAKPWWVELTEYRIKPVKRKRYGRLYVNDKDGWSGSMWTDNLTFVPELDQNSRWIGPWVEYEVDG